VTNKNISLMNAIVQKMRYYEERQKILSENIANMDTVGYKEKDLKALDFKNLLNSSSSQLSLSPKMTNSKHISLSGSSKKTGSRYKTITSDKGVELQDELLKMNKNYTDHKLATTLYQKNMEMLKRAMTSR